MAFKERAFGRGYPLEWLTVDQRARIVAHESGRPLPRPEWESDEVRLQTERLIRAREAEIGADRLVEIRRLALSHAKRTIVARRMRSTLRVRGACSASVTTRARGSGVSRRRSRAAVRTRRRAAARAGPSDGSGDPDPARAADTRRGRIKASQRLVQAGGRG